MVTAGPAMADANEGSVSSAVFRDSASPAVRFSRLLSGNILFIAMMVNIRPITAGIRFAAIVADSGAPKFSAAIMVLGFGDMMFPHFPPPIIIIRSLSGDRP